jgi:2-polyprenyl-3-methyl-5-hydroxy-6-metoxy-1,4-benzoquinol methylase
MGTESDEYATRLITKQQVWWKRLLKVQAVYQWNLRRRDLGRTLDVGCGLGRNLASLGEGSVGVDHNPASVAYARDQGLTAYTVEEFLASDRARPESFDSLLFAHVVEHMPPEAGLQILRDYLPYLRPGGRVLFICPQERGYASDATHVRWTTGEDLVQLARDVGLQPGRWRSFPLPRVAGKIFTYNEFVLEATKP